jgi:YD repeat-containing protein
MVASRTDANGNVIRYTYDALARQASISSPVPSDPQPLVTYAYFLSTPAAPTAHALAHHFDVFHPSDTIDTATFVDGVGRVVQTQNDASLFRGAGQAAETGVLVSGTTIFDALGRPITQYNPTKSTKAFGVYEDSAPFDLVNDPHTSTVYDLWDLPTSITEPGNRVTNRVHGFGQINGAGPQLYMTTETAPNGRATVTYADVRDVVRAVKDVPVGAPAQQTLYNNDGMGQLLGVTDPTGFVTTHTYDELGRRTSTNTPDGGLVTFGYDADGQQISQTTPNLRASNQQISYQYQLHHLTRVDYPGAADDVTYTYGAMGAANNGAGQVVRLEDGARIQRNSYDPAGNVISQTATMKLHAWTPTGDQTRFTWTTQWQYDGLGRLKSMVYPDSERLTYGYDLGGLVNSIAGDEDGVKTIIVGYDALGHPIYQQIPWTWHYNYLNDRQYDVFLHRRYDVDGNGVTTELTFDANTQWLARQQTISPNRDVKNQGAAYQKIQDLAYTYDSVGNPQVYRNNVPPAVTNLFSGPTNETYTYDPYERVAGASGQYDLAPGKVQHFSQSLTFDARGNVTAKNQLDQIRNNNREGTQAQTTYSFSRTYSPTAPHQISTAGSDTYAYDADGNLLTIRDSRARLVRGMTWDANDRMRNVSDAFGSTDYTYDDSGQRAIERGPGGETATLNPWATIRNTTDMYKYVWAGNDRIAEQRDNGGNEELQRYFLHKDLQGSANIVTDPLGNTFQHQEYFPSGEVWFADNSTVFRTPFQYGGGYVDEVRALDNFGDRWYDPIREMMYSPDAVLTDDPGAIVTTPSLRSAYAFAGSNAVANIDPSGRQFTPAQRKAFIKANFQQARAIVAKDPALRASLEANLKTSLPKSFVRLGLDIESADLHQKRFTMIDDVAKPFVEINISTGEVQLSPGLFKQFVARKGSKSSAATQPAPSNQAGATNASGGPVTGASGPSTASGGGDGKTAPSKPVKQAPKPLPKPPHGANTASGSS